MNKITALVFFSCLTALSLRADVLFQDSTNYPYTNGCIEGQGQWYCYLPRIPVLDALVTNNLDLPVAIAPAIAISSTIIGREENS